MEEADNNLPQAEKEPAEPVVEVFSSEEEEEEEDGGSKRKRKASIAAVSPQRLFPFHQLPAKHMVFDSNEKEIIDRMYAWLCAYSEIRNGGAILPEPAGSLLEIYMLIDRFQRLAVPHSRNPECYKDVNIRYEQVATIATATTSTTTTTTTIRRI